MMKSNRPLIESDNTSAAREYARLRGWWTIKIETDSCNGVPDRLYLRRGIYVWVEWKRPGRGDDGLSAIQVKRIKEMKEHGATVYVLDDMDEFKRIMK